MKYVEKYKNLKHMDVVEQHLLYVKNDKKCHSCGSITHFVDIGFEAPFCSEECYEKTADGYLNSK
jgi:hypothetical protein